MTATAAMDLVARAEAKARRLRLFMFVLAATAIVMLFASRSTWYHVEYVNDTFDGVSLETRPAFDVDAGKMAEISRQLTAEPSMFASNPQVSQVANLPLFILTPLIGTAVALFGLWLRSAALTLLAMLGYGYGWMQVSQVRWWFENAPGRDGWLLQRGVGQGAYFLALTVSAATVITASVQAVIAYRAERTARAAAGEVVEDSAFEMLIKIITRTSTKTTSTSSTPSTRSVSS